MTMSIKQNLAEIHCKIAQAAHEANRHVETIKLLAVSKTKPVDQISEAIIAGQYAFGENYVQEGIEKIQFFQQHLPNTPLIWHFIGPLQSNKTRLVAEHFAWLHTLDRLKVAERLNAQRPVAMGNLNVLIQVNISQEQSKSGVNITDVRSLAHEVSQLPRLTLRGLMTIPAIEPDRHKRQATFAHMTELFKQLQQVFPTIDTLSMGMSDDMQDAILAGSTLVRIGSAIFGARDYHTH